MQGTMLEASRHYIFDGPIAQLVESARLISVRSMVRVHLGPLFLSDIRNTNNHTLLRGLSSAGRAPALHAGGQRFDPARLHQNCSLKTR